MAVENQVLHADIVAEDGASAELRKVKAELDNLKRSAGLLNHELHEEGLSFALLAERTEVFRDHFGELGVTFGETGERFAELAPGLEVFGAALSAVGLVDLTREAAEARTQMAAMAEELGITTEQLEGLRLAARETDVPIESMQSGMVKLQRVMVEAASGKNKRAAEIFGLMGIALRDAHGHMRSFTDVMPRVSESLRQTENATLRNTIAMDLFGKSGAALTPFLNLGTEGMKRLAETSERLSAHFSAEDTENVERYKNSWIELDTAFEGLKDTITADLAPVLTPIVNEMDDWIVANRDWLASSITDDVRDFAHWVRDLHLGAFLNDLDQMKQYVDPVVEMAGGWQDIAEVIAILTGARLLTALLAPAVQMAKIGKDITKLTFQLNHDLVTAWTNVGSAAEAAGFKEEAAAHVKPGAGGIAATVGTGAKEGEAAAEKETTETKKFGRTLAAKVGVGLATTTMGIGEFILADAALDALLHPMRTYHAIRELPPLPLGYAGATGSFYNPIAPDDKALSLGPAFVPPKPTPVIPHVEMPTAADLGFINAPVIPIKAPSFRIDRNFREEEEHERDEPAAGDRSEAGGSGSAHGQVEVNIRFANTPDGMTATIEASGDAKAGTIDYGSNAPLGGF